MVDRCNASRLCMALPIALAVANSTWAAEEARPEPGELLRKVRARYLAMKSYSAQGEVISKIQQRTLRHTFSIRLGRPGLYCIQWEQQVHPGFANSGAVWSVGDGDFLKLTEASAPVRQTSRMMALAAATGVSGGAAHTVPSAFVDLPHSFFKGLHEPSQEDDAVIEGKPCDVVSGMAANQKMMLWISKARLLLRQRRHVLGALMPVLEPTDEQIRKALEATGREPTPEAIANARTLMVSAAKQANGIRGSITEIHRNIVINGPLAKDDFRPKGNADAGQ